ncbi:hypothetical protein DOY81_012148, partial [Sarcophaga bullata]
YSADGKIKIRECSYLSTGAILLADILPTLFFKIILPFLPFWMNFYIIVAVAASACGFLMVAFAQAEWMAILGIVFTSASGGIGEAKFMSYSSYFNKNVVSTWSSGTGAAGVVGSISYACLRSLNISDRDTLLLMLFSPVLEAFSFWVLLRSPQRRLTDTYEPEELQDHLATFKLKVLYIKELLRYMVPLVTVYFCEYFINQGLFINVIYFLFEVIFCITPSIWFTLIIVFWEGLLGGGAYVNTFYRISQEVPVLKRKFALAIVIQSDSLGITTAALLAMPVHNAICDLPGYDRVVEW